MGLIERSYHVSYPTQVTINYRKFLSNCLHSVDNVRKGQPFFFLRGFVLCLPPLTSMAAQVNSNSSPPSNVVFELRSRERGVVGKKLSEFGFGLPVLMKKPRVSTTNVTAVLDITRDLKETLKRPYSRETQEAVIANVSRLINKVLDASSPESVFQITPEKREERSLFVSAGGMDVLLALISPPYMRADAREMKNESIVAKKDFLNEILVLLREICYTLPSLAETAFSTEVIVRLFTMLHHVNIFENTMNLLEEILAVKTDTFPLSAIPNLHSLIGKFNTRQMSHFCRVLALALFEP